MGSAKVTTSIGDVVEQGVEVDKSSGIAVLREGGGILFMTLRTLLNNNIIYVIHQRSSVSLELSVVISTIQKTLHLLHVGNPVNLCV